MSKPQIKVTTIHGGLLDQEDVDVFVNPWNRNFVPRLLLVPHGVSGALKKVTGSAPWRDLARYGLLETGEAVLTSGGKLPQDIIHVAGLNAFWVSTEKSISLSARNAVKLAWTHKYRSIAMPLIGAGVGGKEQVEVLNLIKKRLHKWTVENPDEDAMEVRLIVWDKK